ncbi:MAG: carbohydrate kinase family protein, partial [Methanobacterium sp.]
QVIPIFASKTMEFENIYPDDNPNHRIQRSNIPENPIKPHNLNNINFEVFDALLLSPLSPFDLPLDTLEYLSAQGLPIYLGAQGYLRHTENDNVVLKPWKDYEKFLKFVKLLFLDEIEARIILGHLAGSCGKIARILSSFGPEEVIVTRGDRGALVYSARIDGHALYDIPAFPPQRIVDPTGLGDTFMAAYALKKLETDDPEKSGTFASQVSSRKMAHKGAFRKVVQEK